MADAIDTALAIVKWPVALLSLLLLPSIGWAVGDVFGTLSTDELAVWGPVLAGIVGYFLLWMLLFRSPRFGSLLPTFEHELTHAVFAWLTFHRVTGLKATWNQGGQIRYLGKGNWLITIAPYFFPTVSVAAVLVLIWIPAHLLPYASAAVGVSVGYHITSTWHETHPGQTDLQKVSFVFAALFLPTANLVSYGAILAFAFGGGEGLLGFSEQMVGRTRDVVTWIAG